MAPRYFTREQASELLETIRPLAEQLVRHRRAVAVVQAERVELALRVAGNGGGIDPGALALLDERIASELKGVARSVNAIHELGAVVKDADNGLVDFPTRIDGADAYLCWQLGEDEISYWHGIEEGFAGRKLLDP